VTSRRTYLKLIADLEMENAALRANVARLKKKVERCVAADKAAGNMPSIRKRHTEVKHK